MLLAAATLLEGSDGFARPDAGEGFAIGYLAVASTAVAFVLWYRALARLGAERTGLFAGLMPISAALVGAAVTATSLRTGTVIGTLVTGTGVAVGLRSRRTSDRARVESTAGPRVRL
jgi:drug/metabolite transporter (DMT)-like permease